MSEKIQGIESFTKNQVQALIRCLGFGAMLMDWDKLDYEVGRGILEGKSRCLWTTGGHRITITGCQDAVESLLVKARSLIRCTQN